MNDSYKFEIEGRIFYTGKVIEVNDTHLKILTIKEETIIIRKEDIVQAWKLEDRE